jgi:LytS/YehU family sensor histidine kinase
MWIMLWKGNAFLSENLFKKVTWIEYPLKRFVLGMLVTITYTVLAIVGLIEIFERYSPIVFGDKYLYTVYGSVFVTIVISFFLHGRQFLLFWQKASFEKEKFEKESMAARYESLKNQVSPHFLFNSLNALTNLVYEDQDKAVKFIKQLSEVYRYVLDTRDKEVVPVVEELKFLESYLFLQRIRFGNKLTVNVSLPEDGGIRVAPLALQMLIENAIKHNIVSEADPLIIRLYAEDGFLVVQNNLQRKSVTNERTSGVGLENIRKRYEYLSDEKVAIIEDERTFQVRLPELKENRT